MQSLVLFLSNLMIPMIIFYIVVYGLCTKCHIYDAFVKGAEEGIRIVVKICPTLIGLMIAVGILRASGFLSFLELFLQPVTEKIGFPSQLVSLTIVKMFSSSAATGIVLDLFKTYGTDSLIGKITSISMSCTETIFYTMSVYFMTAKVTKTRWTLPGALLSTAAGIVASVFLAGWM